MFAADYFTRLKFNNNMKKVLVALSLVFFLSAGMVSAANFQSANVNDIAVVMVDDDATVNAFVDGDDEKDKNKKKSKDGKCCDKSKKSSCKSKSSHGSKKCCDTKKSCDKSKTSTEVKDKDGK